MSNRARGPLERGAKARVYNAAKDPYCMSCYVLSGAWNGSTRTRAVSKGSQTQKHTLEPTIKNEFLGIPFLTRGVLSFSLWGAFLNPVRPVFRVVNRETERCR